MKLPASETGRPDSLRLAGISSSSEEMHESRELFRKGGDDRNPYFVAVGIEKFLSFLLPISEKIEWMCLEVFGLEGKMKESLENRCIERFMTQIMNGVSERLNELMSNENQTPFLYPTETRLFEHCMRHGGILMKNAFLYRICEMAKKEAISKWNSYSKEILQWIQNYEKEPRYCGILDPIRVLPTITDRLLEAKSICTVIENRMIGVLDNQGPVHNQIREIHKELNGDADSAVKEDIPENGFELIASMATKIREKLGTIAANGPKYTDLILMENLWFLHSTMELRPGAQMETFLEKWNSDFLSAQKRYVDQQISYFFGKFVEFVVSTRQTVDADGITNLRNTMHKSAFAKSASLGNVKRPLAKMRRRVEKHICGDSALLEPVWGEITKAMVEMMTEVEGWGRDGYDGLQIKPSADELRYEMTNLKATL